MPAPPREKRKDFTVTEDVCITKIHTEQFKNQFNLSAKIIWRIDFLTFINYYCNLGIYAVENFRIIFHIQISRPQITHFYKHMANKHMAFFICFMCIKVWPKPLCAYIVLKFKIVNGYSFKYGKNSDLLNKLFKKYCH